LGPAAAYASRLWLTLGVVTDLGRDKQRQSGSVAEHQDIKTAEQQINKSAEGQVITGLRAHTDLALHGRKGEHT
jgi:hypothetical protein